MEYAMVDATIVKVNRHGQGENGGLKAKPLVAPKGGTTTKILALIDAQGNLVRFRLMRGQRFDSVEVSPLIDGIAFKGLIADKAFASNAIITDLDERGAAVVI